MDALEDEGLDLEELLISRASWVGKFCIQVVKDCQGGSQLSSFFLWLNPVRLY